MKKSLSVRENIVTGLEISDEFFEFLEDSMIGSGGFTFATAVVP
jgi:hypothetical protein